LLAVVIFVLGSATTQPPIVTSPSDADFAAFHMAEKLDTAESWNAFLRDHENGELVPVARDRLQQVHARNQEFEKKVAEFATPESTRKPAPVAAPSPAPPKDATKAAEAAPRLKLVDTVAMPAGVFMMGSDSGKGDERPRHQIRLESFRISPTPITNRQYFTFLEESGRQRPKDPGFAKNYLMDFPDHPVVNVSYDDAVAFCKWASTKLGVPMRLPTEAEWEYAANSQNTSNLLEWVSDYYAKDYYTISPVKDPTGPATGSKRVVRGGGLRTDGDTAIHRRGNRDPKDRSDQVGFRVVIDSHAKR
jgi:formylglycine-generating enzyme required for sulfatase activity